MFTKLEINPWGLTEYFHPFPSGSGSHGELRHWLQLVGGDSEGSHSLWGDHIAIGVSTIDKGHCGEAPQPDGDVGAVVLGLAGLEVDLHNLGGYSSHGCKIIKSLREQSGGKGIAQDKDLITSATIKIQEVGSDAKRGSRDGPYCLLPGDKIQP